MARAAVLMVGAGLLVGGLPAVQNHAEAAPKGRCSDLYGTPNQAPPQSSLPGYRPPGPGQYETPNAESRAYDYNNYSYALDALQLPSDPEELKAYGTETDKHPKGSKARAYAAWNRNQAGDKPTKLSFNRWLNRYFIQNEGNEARGARFEREVVRHFKLGGKDWFCQGALKDFPDDVEKKVRERMGKNYPKGGRDYDAVNHRTKTIYEFKSGNNVSRAQLRVDKVMRQLGYKIVYVHGQKPTQAALRNMNGAGVERFQHRATPQKRWSPGRYTSSDRKLMNPNPKQGSLGAANDMFRNSGRNQAEARAYARDLSRGKFADQRMRGPGGVDFSSLELKYVGEPVKGKGLDYAFHAKENPAEDPDAAPSWGGMQKAQLASDAFFTWLALTPEKFWVNLNPDQPDKVMDSKFGKTDAGRVLLEADLQMKHDFYKAMDPKTDLGKQFWDALPRQNGLPCLHGIRNWIEPDPAKVREQDGGIYILDAPLELNSTPQEFVSGGPGEPICSPSKAETEQAQRVVDRMIVPAVEKTINTAPQYADLRRVYSSRVAAEWIRQQDQGKATDFRKIINSNDASRWPLRGENADWDKNELFQRYAKIFREGEFQYEMEYGGTVMTYIVGGVDFSKSPKRNITRTRFNAENPKLPEVTKGSKGDALSYRDSDTMLMGGNTHGETAGGGGGDDDPTPTPTPSDDPDPSGTPTHEPSPSPTGKPGDGGDPSGKPGGGDSAVKPEDPDGDLAGTGSNVGGIAALAAALLAAGGFVTWWIRRRGALQK